MTASSTSLPPSSQVQSHARTPANFQLDDFYVTKLNLGFTYPENLKIGDEIEGEMSFTFDYEVGVHKVEKNRYKVTFRLTAQEQTQNGEPLGKNIDAEITGTFLFEKSKAKDEMDFYARMNGISTLYGILRGVIATSSGLFPGDKIVLPSIMPQTIVALVDEARHNLENAPHKRE